MGLLYENVQNTYLEECNMRHAGKHMLEETDKMMKRPLLFLDPIVALSVNVSCIIYHPKIIPIRSRIDTKRLTK